MIEPIIRLGDPTICESSHFLASLMAPKNQGSAKTKNQPKTMNSEPQQRRLSNLRIEPPFPGRGLQALAALLALAVALLPLSANAASVASFTAFFSFGDSLTDSGNVAAATGGAGTYPSGRFSDGPTWAEYLSSDLGLGPHGPSLAGGPNHAWGGAWTDGGGAVPTLVQQVGGYIGGGGSFQSTDLVALWAGANDFFGTALDPGGPVNPTVPVANISTALSLLAGAGAQQVLILNLPDLGATPQLQGNAGATSWAMGYNFLLSNEIALQRDALGITIYEADIFARGADIAANPGNYGLINVTDPLYPGLTLDPGTTAYVDGIHPTTVVHRVFAQEALNSIPEPSTGMLSLVAIGLLARRRRRS
jgi:outer membrane lipase/esterase